MIRLWTDFNEIFDEDYVWTSLRRTPQLEAWTVSEGDPVELHDDDGSTCWGKVWKRVGPIVTVKIDWDTWTEVSTGFTSPSLLSAAAAIVQGDNVVFA